MEKGLQNGLKCILRDIDFKKLCTLTLRKTLKCIDMNT